MNTRTYFPRPVVLLAISLSIGTTGVRCKDLMDRPPDIFTRFKTAGASVEASNDLGLMRDMYWNHLPYAGPTATLWDEWLASPSLWPETDKPSRPEWIRNSWDSMLSKRIIDADGYVATHQHQSIAHQLGWPFPFWNQGVHGFGWHFSFKDTVGPNWRPDVKVTPDDWGSTGILREKVGDAGWNFTLSEPRACLAPPLKSAHAVDSPFIQIRWSGKGLGNAQPFIEWTTANSPDYSPDKRMSFAPVDSSAIHYTMIPVFHNPAWHGEIRNLRIDFDNPTTGATVCLQALFAQYDTRQNVNNPSYVDGCITYFNWTHDLDFLRRNINRMREAIRYGYTEFGIGKNGCVLTRWVGHNGRGGFSTKSGKRVPVSGQGIGSNYWDLLPFGYKDGYASVRWYAAVEQMAQLEKAIDDHPEWNMPDGVTRTPAARLERTARKMKEVGNKLFWNPETSRFAIAVDIDGKQHDFGYTFMNLEAVYYHFSTPEHARAIMDWIDGKRIVADDTSTGTDIYHWIFAPRSSTRRNTDYYGWYWNGETVPWGTQVQDGGAVLGFSYHDIMSRLQVTGADDAWKRLDAIARWYGDVQKAGGYRKYYDGETHDGNLQGGGTAGGLGMDEEFHETVLLPTTVLDGFMGFRPTPEGFTWKPELPSALPSLTVVPVWFRDQKLNLKASKTDLVLERTGPEPMDIWTANIGEEWKPANGPSGPRVENAGPGKWKITWGTAKTARWTSR